jgi:Glyoxalase/Bleomycin resistance protein/Dioxygenase superfamily
VGTRGLTLGGVAIGDEPDAWRNAGFAIDATGGAQVGTVRLDIAGRAAGPGLVGWTLAGPDDVDGGAATTVDGLPTTLAAWPDDDLGPGDHPNGVRQLDHLVVVSPDLDRTTAALGALGIEPRRDREAGGGRRQRFFRLGEALLELIGPADPAGDGPARLWGLAFTVADLDATVRTLAGRIGAPKDAVQPGRRIATLHAGDAVSVPVAFMSAGGTGPGRR